MSGNDKPRGPKLHKMSMDEKRLMLIDCRYYEALYDDCVSAFHPSLSVLSSKLNIMFLYFSYY